MTQTQRKTEQPEPEKLLIDEDDLIDLDEMEQVQMNSIVLKRMTPDQFGLDSWSTETFTIPNTWMQKIYQRDASIDTDIENERPEPEKMSDYQRKVLYDWLKGRKGHTNFLGPTRRSRTVAPPDELADFLFTNDNDSSSGDDSDVILIDGSEDSEGTENEQYKDDTNIAICDKHRILGEEGIVRKALEKMKNLSADEERKYQELLKDEDFMVLLNSHVKKYIKE